LGVGVAVPLQEYEGAQVVAAGMVTGVPLQPPPPSQTSPYVHAFPSSHATP
jgi:hypothetical protein